MQTYETVKAIAALVGRSPRTVQRWIHKHGFPAAKLPNGNLFTTDQLINQWILARNDVYVKSRAEERAAKGLDCPVIGKPHSKAFQDKA